MTFIGATERQSGSRSMLDEGVRATLCHTLAGLELHGIEPGKAQGNATGTEQHFALRLRVDPAAGVLIEGGGDGHARGFAPIALSDERVVLMSRDALRHLHRSAADLLASHPVGTRETRAPAIDPAVMPTAAEMLAGFKRPLMPLPRTPTDATPPSTPARRHFRTSSRRAPVLAAIVLVAAIATGVWGFRVLHATSNQASAAHPPPGGAAEKVVSAASPAQRQLVESTPVPPPAPLVPATATATPPAQAGLDPREAAARVEPDIAATTSATAPAATDPVTEAAPVVAASVPTKDAVVTAAPPPQLMIHARQTSWVTLHDRDGKLVGQRLLSAGQDWALPLRAGLRLTTGNAGGTEVEMDGAQTESLGAMGAVRRDVELDALAR